MNTMLFVSEDTNADEVSNTSDFLITSYRY